MTNHVHLLIQVSDVPLSKIMQNISFRFTRWINKHQKRIGHLFQGRYKAILIDSDQYLLELIRYIHLNPVRSKLVKNATEYPWSSHSTYLGLEMLPWLTTDWVFGHFSRQRAACIRQYSRFIDEGLGESHRSDFHGGSIDGRILGNDVFTERVLSSLDAKTVKPPILKKIIKTVCAEFKVDENQLDKLGRQRNVTEVRAIIAYLSVELKSATLTEVAQKFDRDVSTISIAVRKIEKRREGDKEFHCQLELMINAINKA